MSNELFFEVVEAKYSPKNGITCHIIASVNQDDLYNMQTNQENVKVFECKQKSIRELKNQEKIELIDGIDYRDQDEDEDEDEDEDQDEDAMVGGGSKKMSKMIKTHNLAHFLSKMSP